MTTSAAGVPSPQEPAPTITDAMIEKSARAYAKLEGNDYDAVSTGNRMAFYGAAGAILEAALAGCAVVELPTLEGSQVAEADFSVDALVRSTTGEPRVHLDAVQSGADDETCVSWHADTAERVGLALVAAAREARRLSGSRKDDQT